MSKIKTFKDKNNEPVFPRTRAEAVIVDDFGEKLDAHLITLEDGVPTQPITPPEIGNRTYTEQNVVTSGESVTDSIDALDVAVADNVITSGSNANGSWTKFPDGTMICRQSITLNKAISGAYGGAYRSGGDLVTFPATFIETPIVSFAMQRDDETIGNSFAALGNTSLIVYFLSVTSVGAKDRILHIKTEGRWKA